MSGARRITRALLAKWPLPLLDTSRGKASRGTLLVAGGSDTVAGAVVLAGIAGLRAGAGTLQIATTKGAAITVATAVPEAKVLALRTQRGELAGAAAAQIEKLAADCDAVALGPGSAAPHIVRAAKGPACWIVDAAAIAPFAALSRRPPNAVLTPHVGEMAALCGLETEEVMARCADLARETARSLACVVVLKGEQTHIAAPDGSMFTNTAGNHGLGTSGSGDVLAGIIAGLAARGASPVQAAVWGVHVHGRAGEILARRVGKLGYLARELPAEVPSLLER